MLLRLTQCLEKSLADASGCDNPLCFCPLDLPQFGNAQLQSWRLGLVLNKQLACQQGTADECNQEGLGGVGYLRQESLIFLRVIAGLPNAANSHRPDSQIDTNFPIQ